MFQSRRYRICAGRLFWSSHGGKGYVPTGEERAPGCRKAHPRVLLEVRTGWELMADIFSNPTK